MAMPRISYITENGTDVISHRIDFSSPAGPGKILYGDFQVQHDLDTFRKQFVVPQECQANNLLPCNSATVKRLSDKYHKGRTALFGV